VWRVLETVVGLAVGCRRVEMRAVVVRDVTAVVGVVRKKQSERGLVVGVKGVGV
jgi:hypothetical protein